MNFHTLFSAKASTNTCQMKMFNLTEESISTLSIPSNRWQLTAGYEQDNGLVLEGTIKNLEVAYNGITRTISFILDERPYNNGNLRIQLNIRKGVSTSAVITSVVRAMGGIIGKIDIDTEESLQEPITLYGNATKILANLAKDVNAYVSYNDGKINILSNDRTAISPTGRSTVVLTASSGLLTKPARQKGGLYKVKTLFNYRFKLGTIVNIDTVGLGRIQDRFIRTCEIRKGKMDFSRAKAEAELEVRAL